MPVHLLQWIHRMLVNVRLLPPVRIVALLVVESTRVMIGNVPVVQGCKFAQLRSRMATAH